MSHVKCSLRHRNATLQSCWGLMHPKLPVPTGEGRGYPCNGKLTAEFWHIWFQLVKMPCGHTRHHMTERTSGHEHPLPRRVGSPLWPHLASLSRLPFLLWAPFPRAQRSPPNPCTCQAHAVLPGAAVHPAHLPIPLAGSISIGQAEMAGEAGTSMCRLPFMITPQSPSHPQNEKHGSAPYSIWRPHSDLATWLLIGHGLQSREGQAEAAAFLFMETRA